MSDELRILILEDNSSDAELMIREVRKAAIDCSALRVESEKAFRQQLKEFRPGLILADYALPNYDGLSALAVAREESPDVPYIVVTGTRGEEAAVDILHRGAVDYILKSHISRLGPAVRRALSEARNREQLRRAETRLRDSEMRYRRLFESAKDGILILDAETGEVVDVNPFMIELLGLSYDGFRSKKIWELGFLKDVVANESLFAELVRNEYVRYEDKALEARDGHRAEVEFVSNVYDVNGRKVIQCNIRDITARKRAESELRQRTEELNRRNDELLRFNRTMVGREERMAELKLEVNELCSRLGEPARHIVSSREASDAAYVGVDRTDSDRSDS